MTIRQQILGSDDQSTAVTSALKAVEAAQAALESAYLNLLSIARQIVSETPLEVSGGCVHPESARAEVGTFAGVEYLCGVCGESISQ